MSLINSLKLVVKPLRALILSNSCRIENIEDTYVSAPKSNDEVLNMLIDLNACPAVTDAEGFILTDENGAILMM